MISTKQPPETASLAIIKNAGSSHFSAVDLEKRTTVADLGDGTYPHTALFHPNGRYAYLLYITSAHLEVVDLTTLETVDRVDDLGTASIGSALSPDGRRLFVGTAAELPDAEVPGVVAFELEAGGAEPRAIGSTTLPRTAGMTIGPDGRLYVALKKRGELLGLSPTRTLAERARYDVGEKPHDIYPVPGTGLLAVNNAGEASTTFVDVVGGTVVGDAPVGENPHGMAFAGTPAGRRAIVPAREDRRIALVDLDAVEAGAVDRATTFVDVDTTTGFAAVGPIERYALVDSYDDPFVTVVDLTDASVAARIDVGGEPLHVVPAADGRECYVGNMDDDRLAVLDTAPLASDDPQAVAVDDRIEGLGEMPSGIFRPQGGDRE